MGIAAWKSFLEVCRLGSLSAAATELGYTQSAVSRQVAGLERAVGAALLERRPRGVAPTAAGAAFLRHAHVVVTESERAVSAARRATETSRLHLTVGATPSVAAGVFPRAIGRLPAAPDAPVLTLLPGLTAELEVKAAAGELDYAVVTDAPPGLTDNARLHRQALGVDQLCVMVPHGHAVAGMGPMPLEAFARERWAEDNAGSEILLRRHAARAGFDPHLEHRVADLLGKIGMVAAGQAVAMVPALLIATLPTAVTAVPLTDPPSRGIFAITPTRSRPDNGFRDTLTVVLRTVMADLLAMARHSNDPPG